MMDDLVNVLWTESLVYVSENHMAAHQHDFFHCIYVVKGSGKIHLNEKKLKLIPGCFYIVRPGITHSFGADKNIELMLLEIKFEVHDEKIFKKLMSFSEVTSVIDTPIYTILKRIRTELAEKKPLFSVIASLNLREILTIVERCIIDEKAQKECKSGEQIDKFMEIIGYIHENLDREITLQELADKVHLEKSYFLKRFKKEYRCTPIKYAKVVRIEKAKELLVHSDKNITQIAEALGFKSIHHFSRQFTKIEGVSPKIYKDNN